MQSAPPGPGLWQCSSAVAVVVVAVPAVHNRTAGPGYLCLELRVYLGLQASVRL